MRVRDLGLEMRALSVASLVTLKQSPFFTLRLSQIREKQYCIVAHINRAVLVHKGSNPEKERLKHKLLYYHQQMKRV